MPVTPLPDDFGTMFREINRRLAVLENTNSLLHGSVTDASGTLRFETGDLPARGVSPAQFGWRVDDAGGNPIADSLGLIKQTLLANDQGTANTVVTNDGSTDGVVISGSGTSFSVTRACTVLVWAQQTASVSPAGSYTRNRAYIKQGATTIAFVFTGYSNSNEYTSCFGQFWVNLPAAGTYTVEQHSLNSSGFSTTYVVASCQVQLVGA